MTTLHVITIVNRLKILQNVLVKKCLVGEATPECGQNDYFYYYRYYRLKELSITLSHLPVRSSTFLEKRRPK